jgi:hypothetical protein
MVSALSVYPPGARIRESAAPKKTAERQRKEGSGRKGGRRETAFWLVDDDVTCLALPSRPDVQTSSHHITSRPRIASSIDFALHCIHIIPSIHTIHPIPFHLFV